jgi:hypothetical protein
MYRSTYLSISIYLSLSIHLHIYSSNYPSISIYIYTHMIWTSLNTNEHQNQQTVRLTHNNPDPEALVVSQGRKRAHNVYRR